MPFFGNFFGTCCNLMQPCRIHIAGSFCRFLRASCLDRNHNCGTRGSRQAPQAPRAVRRVQTNDFLSPLALVGWIPIVISSQSQDYGTTMCTGSGMKCGQNIFASPKSPKLHKICNWSTAHLSSLVRERIEAHPCS